MIKGIHHVAIKCGSVEEFEKTVRFYRETLGLKLLRSWGEGSASGAMLQTGAGIIEIFAQGKTQGETGSVNHFALSTDNVDEVLEAVRNAGYQITVEAKDLTIPSEVPFPVRIGFCIGPVGEEIEFFTER